MFLSNIKNLTCHWSTHLKWCHCITQNQPTWQWQCRFFQRMICGTHKLDFQSTNQLGKSDFLAYNTISAYILLNFLQNFLRRFPRQLFPFAILVSSNQDETSSTHSINISNHVPSSDFALPSQNHVLLAAYGHC